MYSINCVDIDVDVDCINQTNCVNYCTDNDIKKIFARWGVPKIPTIDLCELINQISQDTEQDINILSRCDKLTLIGRSILRTALSYYLYSRYPNSDEGFLTIIRAKLENNAMLYKYAVKEKLFDIFPEKNIVMLFKLLLGYIFTYTFNLTSSINIIIDIIESHIYFDTIISNNDDYKSNLIKYYHANKYNNPTYDTKVCNLCIFERYISFVYDDLGHRVSIGYGSKKKDAEQASAKDALCFFNDTYKDVYGKIKTTSSNEIRDVHKYLTNNDVGIKTNSVSDTVEKKYYIDKKIINNVFANNNISYYVKNIHIYVTAFIHKSTDSFISYERLEFLGDSILHMIIMHYVYKRFDKELSGFFTKVVSILERTETLCNFLKILKLNHHIISTQSSTKKIFEDCFEAFIGAFFIDSNNYDIVYTFVENLFESHIDFSTMLSKDDNYKDIVNRYCHKNRLGNVDFIHTLKNDKYYAYITNKLSKDGQMLYGYGYSKKKAEICASYAFLKYFDEINNDVDHDINTVNICKELHPNDDDDLSCMDNLI
jgi:ribonuclease III